jgi:hypothetical protein
MIGQPADMAELVDAPDLGSGFARSEGSSPFIRIKKALADGFPHRLRLLSFS